MTLTGTILITGGSGTLGHAIARAARAEGWDCRITIYSRSELRQAEMRARYPECRFVLGDVRDYDRLAAAMAGHDLVIHAAAMKRIPECEAQPGECYATNVGGSQNVVRAAQAAGVARVVGISTDKACAAITTYGASKRVMEGLFRTTSGRTVFTLCRYGNVLASNGSVIPLWRQQAARGEKLTITDRRMTRFWMTERQAVRTIEQAATCATPGALVVPKMGAVRVVDMAEWIVPGAELTATGLRGTEKLHEDLVHPCEPAFVRGDVFVLHADGQLGYQYTSETAPRIDRHTFLAMLAESETSGD